MKVQCRWNRMKWEKIDVTRRLLLNAGSFLFGSLNSKFVVHALLVVEFPLCPMVVSLFFARCSAYAVDSWCKFLQSTEKFTWTSIRWDSGTEKERKKKDKRGFKATQFESMAKWWQNIVFFSTKLPMPWRAIHRRVSDHCSQHSSEKMENAFWVFIIRIQFKSGYRKKIVKEPIAEWNDSFQCFPSKREKKLVKNENLNDVLVFHK